MRFSEAFSVDRSGRDDWFDIDLEADVALFIDPFLIFLDDEARWTKAHDHLVEFFNLVLGLVAQSGLRARSLQWNQAKALMLFPEPAEFCLGFGWQTIHGRGSSRGLQTPMMRAAADTISAGIDQVAHFEELALFGRQIGPDRISDITCNVLKAEFVRYTQQICKRHSIPTEDFVLAHAGWDARGRRWVPKHVQLPRNPEQARRTPILLAPERFMRGLHNSPLNLEGEDFWDWAWSNEDAATLRRDFNYDVGRHVDAAEIARLARTHRDTFRRYVEWRAANPRRAYDIENDPDFIVTRREGAADIAAEFDAPTPTSKDSFETFVDSLIQNFKHCVEDRNAWQLLWARDAPRRETQASALFQTSAVFACRTAGVDITPESNAGRGPVDFKVSNGWNLRALIELKKGRSSSFWRNLRNQVPLYARAESVDRAYVLVLQFLPADFEQAFIDNVKELTSIVGAQYGISYEAVFVDARKRPSASTAGN